MSPNFAAAVDPVFLKVLALFDKVQQDTVEMPEAEQLALNHQLSEVETKLPDADAWGLAKYALVCWIDDVLIAMPWKGRGWWENNSMEFAHFKIQNRAVEFFRRAKDAAKASRRDALEVFYLCVVLGFRGLYELDEKELIADQLDLPPSLELWAQSTRASLQLKQGRPRFTDEVGEPQSAPPLESRRVAIGVAVVTVILTILLLMLSFWNWAIRVDAWHRDHESEASVHRVSEESLL